LEPETGDFRIVELRPFELLAEGWRLVRDQYWLMLGITVVGLIVGSLAPLGLFMGPMVCGIYLGLFARMRSESATFAGLFRGFEFFVPSFIATLIQIVPIMAMAIPVNLILLLVTMKRVLIWLGRPYSDVAAMLGPWEMAIIVAVTTIVIFLLSVFFGTFFMFGYPLIVDRRMGGWEAVKLSARASRANFGGAARLMATTTILSIVASLFCYVGGFMVTPITLAAWAIAYRRIFPAPAPISSNP
jgi:uncharacterized membrane protein